MLSFTVLREDRLRVFKPSLENQGTPFLFGAWLEKGFRLRYLAESAESRLESLGTSHPAFCPGLGVN